MSKIATALAVCAALLSAAPATEAAPVPGPSGRFCGLRAVSDPNPEAPPGTATGTMDAGPMAWDRPFEVMCSVQIDNNVHSGPDAARSSAASTDLAGTNVATMLPTPVSYSAPEESQAYMCTEARSSSGTVYWQTPDPGQDGILGTADDTPGYWTPDPSATCATFTQICVITPEGIVCFYDP